MLAERSVDAARLRAVVGRSETAAVQGLDESARRVLRALMAEGAPDGGRIGQPDLLRELLRVDDVARLVREAAALVARPPAPPDGSRSRLVILEGIMGAGKSWTGQWLARELGRHGVVARFLAEGRTIEEPEHPLRVATTLPHPKAPWRDVTPDELVERSLAMWRAFVESARAAGAVTVCDGQLFHGNLTDLMIFDAEPGTLAAYVQAVVETAGPLAPAAVYLRQTDVPAALRRVSDQRGPEWVTYQVDWKLASPYARRRGLQGYEGLVELYEAYVALCLGLLDGLPMPKLVIERDGDWPRARREIREFLSLG
jgi:hypothetical protein